MYCPLTLHEFIENKKYDQWNMDEKKLIEILSDLSSGVNHLHKLDIIHRLYLSKFI